MTAAVANTTSVVRVMNERAVWERIREAGPVSAPQLAADTGLSKPTISLAIANLERVGLIRQVGLRTGRAGRAPRLYELRPEAGWVIAVDVGRSWVRLAAADLAGDIVGRRAVHSRARTARSLVTQLGDLAHELATELGVPYDRVLRTVVGSPGVHDPVRGVVRLAPNLPGWERPGVVEALHARIGVGLVIENDVNLAALGEQAYGLGHDSADFVFVSVGTGVGMGVVIDGQLYRGSHGRAGEISFLPLPGQRDTGRSVARRRHGPLESAAAADAIVATARDLGLGDAGSVKDVFVAAHGGDERALRAVAIEAEHLAQGLAAVVAVLDPELIVLGGALGHDDHLFTEPIHRRLDELLGTESPRLAVSALGDEAVVLGGLAVGLREARDVAFQRAAAAASSGVPGASAVAT